MPARRTGCHEEEDDDAALPPPIPHPPATKPKEKEMTKPRSTSYHPSPVGGGSDSDHSSDEESNGNYNVDQRITRQEKQQPQQQQLKTTPKFDEVDQFKNGTPTNDPLVFVCVQGAGNQAVNGDYQRDGYFENTYRFSRCGEWNGERALYSIFQCNVSNNTKQWYISIVPVEGQPGTSADIDFYFAPPISKEEDCHYEHQLLPPCTGWTRSNEGKEPCPTLSFKMFGEAQSYHPLPVPDFIKSQRDELKKIDNKPKTEKIVVCCNCGGRRKIHVSYKIFFCPECQTISSGSEESKLPATIHYNDPPPCQKSSAADEEYHQRRRRDLPKPPTLSKMRKYQQWLKQATNNGYEFLKYAPDEARGYKSIVRVAVTNYGMALQFATSELKKDRTIVMTAVKQNGWALQYAYIDLRNDEEIIKVAVDQNQRALKYACNKDFVLDIVQQNGSALEFAPDQFRNDKVIVMAAVQSNPDAIKFALGDNVRHDPKILVAAGMFDENHYDVKERRGSKKNWMATTTTASTTTKITLSTRFALNPNSASEATNFTKMLKDSKYIQESDNNFLIYAPNAFDKKTCDPKWTDFQHPCRGTKDTCQYNNVLTDTGHPTDDCCWRYSFRCQLEEAKFTGGFMLQLVERERQLERSAKQTLGNGQRIERDMAKDLEMKIFQVYRPIGDSFGYEGCFQPRHMKEVIAAIKAWYDGGCEDMSECFVRPVWLRKCNCLGKCDNSKGCPCFEAKLPCNSHCHQEKYKRRTKCCNHRS